MTSNEKSASSLSHYIIGNNCYRRTNLKIKIINPLQYVQWDDVLLNHPDATVFHSSRWAKVLCESYGYEPVYFAAFENGYPKFLLPFMDIKSTLTGRRGVSLPFTDYCGVILPDGDAVPGYFAMVESFGRQIGWKYFEVRSDLYIADSIEASMTFYRHLLTLNKGEKSLWAGLRDSTRRNIKKAVNAGIIVVRENSSEALSQFYRLNCMTRKRHGLPPQPFRYFEKLFEHILSKGFGVVALAYHGKKIISANIYLHFGHQAIFKYGASNPRYQSLRANNLLQWEMIRWYVNNGFEQFCFGRTEVDNAGLLQFKRGWGADETIIAYHRYNFENAAFVKSTPQVGRLQKRLFGSMPLSILGLCGKFLYKHIG